MTFNGIVGAIVGAIVGMGMGAAIVIGSVGVESHAGRVFNVTEVVTGKDAFACAQADGVGAQIFALDKETGMVASQASLACITEAR
jgi:hypothetical protein